MLSPRSLRSRSLPNAPHLLAPLLAWALWPAFGCDPINENSARPQQAGEACGQTEACAGGLVCGAQGTCVPFGDPGSGGLGDGCLASTDCQLELYCNGAGHCARPRSGDPGDLCTADPACRSDLVCAHEGICASPGDEGTTPASEACGADEDCGYGLVCGLDETCIPIPTTPGVECPLPDDEAPPHMLFEVPRIGGDAGPFFSLPFPNDVRQRDGLLDLWGYPSPETATLVEPYAEAAIQDLDGFGLSQAVVMRFSTSLDFSTLTFGGDDASLVFVDITPGASSRGRRPRARFFATTSRSRYICADWLAIRPSEGSPLEPGRTYAVYLLSGLTADDGRPLVPAPDLQQVMGDQAPSDPGLLAAWRQYAPLRSWLAEEGVSADRVVGATVFTTGQPTASLYQLPALVNAQTQPEIAALTSCDGGATSPCEGAGERTCGERNDLYTELHGRVALPRLLRGNAPYASIGGDIVREADGAPRLQGTEDVCVAVSIPRGAEPESGWPVVVYAHETDGNFRSFVTDGFAARMARLGYAVISYDGVLHGPRRGADPEPETPLAQRLSPIERPLVMRDLRLQGAADLHQIVRLLDLPLPRPTNPALFDTSRVAFVGAGFGGEVGALFLAATDRIGASVLTATGGQFIQVMLARQDDARLRAQLQLALSDQGLNGMHPGINLIQSHLDPVDPVNIGSALTFQRGADRPMHLMMVYGVGDVATPALATHSLAISARLPLLAPVFEPLDAIEESESTEVRGNFQASGQPITRGLKQYDAPEGLEPSRVGLEAEEATADIDHFLGTFISDPEGVPTIGR